jgi:glutathione synthase/RimK-type ligase-like ATP-grasp enzyme
MRLAIFTPSPDEPRFAAIIGQWFERLAAPLRAAGIEPVAVSWTDPGDLARFDGVAPLLAWSYHRHQDQWLALLDRLEASGIPVANRAATLRWNTRKTYLAELEAAGAPVIPTLFVDHVTPEAVIEAHDRFGPEIIIKPQVSGGSHETVRLAAGADLAGGPAGPAMLQPFLPSVTAEGELSLLYFDGVFSHAVSKIAGRGDYRVQYQHGGRYQPLTPGADALKAADQVLAAGNRSLTYARIDLLRGADGVLRLMELEAIEPDLYLEHAPDGGAAFARAMIAAIGVWPEGP